MTLPVLAYWGDPCPHCKTPVAFLSTTNQWAFYCDKCDLRFNKDGEAKPV